MAKAYLQVIAHYFAQPGNGDKIVAPRTELAAATRAASPNTATLRVSRGSVLAPSSRCSIAVK